MKLLTPNDVCNLLRESDKSLKSNIKTLAAAHQMSMYAYVNMVMEKHVLNIKSEHPMIDEQLS